MEEDDLSRHRMRYKFNGWPTFDDDGDIVHVVTEPAWAWSALTEDQQAVIRQEAVRLQGRVDLSWDEAFSFAIEDFGVACPHKWKNREPWFSECEWCHVAEPLPGRVVQVGDDTLRVADPPPPVLRIPVPQSVSIWPDPATPSGPAVVEYRWTGKRYVAVDR